MSVYPLASSLSYCEPLYLRDLIRKDVYLCETPTNANTAPNGLGGSLWEFYWDLLSRSLSIPLILPYPVS